MSNYTSHLLNVPYPVSTLATHPTKPLITVGCITGHVYTYTWTNGSDNEGQIGTAGGLTAGYKLLWKTKRHKGSCRSLGYSYDGDLLYSTGTDNLIKSASISTGQVVAKYLIPSQKGNDDDSDHPTHLLPITLQHLAIGTDLSNLHLYDLRAPSSSSTPQTHLNLHDNAPISSISALPPTSTSTSNLPRSLITTGSFTLRPVDLRTGPLPPSDPQDDDLLSSTVVQNVGKNRRYTRAYCGMDNGTIHAFERGVWNDMVERIKIAKKDVEVDVLVDVADCGFGKHDVKTERAGVGAIAAGCGDGIVRVVRLGGNRVVEEFEHEEGMESGEGVVALAVDCDGALVSGGGEGVRIWYEKDLEAVKEVEEKDSEDEEDSDDDDKDKSNDDDQDSDEDDEGSGGWSSDSDSDGPSRKKKKDTGNKKKRKKGKENMKGLPSRKKKNVFAGLD